MSQSKRRTKKLEKTIESTLNTYFDKLIDRLKTDIVPIEMNKVRSNLFSLLNTDYWRGQLSLSEDKYIRNIATFMGYVFDDIPPEKKLLFPDDISIIECIKTSASTYVPNLTSR